jgi:hypothetical protein
MDGSVDDLLFCFRRIDNDGYLKNTNISSRPDRMDTMLEFPKDLNPAWKQATRSDIQKPKMN